MPDTNYTYTTLGDGRVVSVTPATAVVFGAAQPCRRIVATALPTNTDVVAVGASTVLAALGSRRGITLAPGQSVEVPIDDVSKLYLDAVVAGEGVTFVYFNN